MQKQSQQHEIASQNKIDQLLAENKDLHATVDGLRIENERVALFCRELEEKFLQLEPKKTSPTLGLTTLSSVDKANSEADEV